MNKESGHTALDEIRPQWRLMTVYERFEQFVAITLSGVIALVIVISLIQLIRLVFTLLVMDALNPLDHKVFQLVFGATMTLLIAMEFKHSIVKVALRKESIIQVKTVILIAILALARKFIILEPDVDPAKVAVLAGTVLALGLTYWLMRERDDRKIGRHDARSRHRWLNRFQTALLVLTLVGLAAAAGSLLFGEIGLWLALATCALTLLIEPVAASAMTLRLYGARPLRPDEAPAIWSLLRALAARAGLPNTPVPYYVPSDIVNAFATGSRRLASIALTDGLLRSLSMRELQAVLAHEVAHIAQEDLRVMGLADSISRLTNLLALLGQVALLISMPALLVGAAEINWIGLLLLAASPQLALLAQLGLSRVREFDADRMAVELTGDPHGLASALAKIERVSRSWRAWLLPGWGNPEPSWLRTHPATEDRIARLMALAPQPSQALPFQTEYLAPRSFAPMRPPRRGLSGLWR
eukprot:gene56-72_t